MSAHRCRCIAIVERIDGTRYKTHLVEHPSLTTRCCGCAIIPEVGQIKGQCWSCGKIHQANCINPGISLSNAALRLYANEGTWTSPQYALTCDCGEDSGIIDMIGRHLLMARPGGLERIHVGTAPEIIAARMRRAAKCPLG